MTDEPNQNQSQNQSATTLEYEHDPENLNPATDPTAAHPVGTEAAFPQSDRPLNPDPPASDAYRATPNPDWSSSNPPAYPAVDDTPEAYDSHESIHEDVAAGVAQLKQNSAANLPGTYVHSAIIHLDRVLRKLESGFTGKKKDEEVK